MAAKEKAEGWKPKKMLKGKTVIVTGCSSGIGEETARLVKRLGGDVIGVDLDMPGDDVDEFYRADLSDERTIRALVKALPKGADGLANMVGLSPAAPAEMILRVNLVAPRHLTGLLVPRLADGASVVSLASVSALAWSRNVEQIRAGDELDFDGIADFVRRHGFDGTEGHAHRFASEALVVWTLRSAWRWRDRGIRINCVSPGPAGAAMPPDVIETLGDDANEEPRTMGRPATAADVAPVVAFLLSDMASMVTGADIPVDGGLSSRILCDMHRL